MRHGTCFRRRLSARHAGAAPHSAVAELGVVRPLRTLTMNPKAIKTVMIGALALVAIWLTYRYSGSSRIHTIETFLAEAKSLQPEEIEKSKSFVQRVHDYFASHSATDDDARLQKLDAILMEIRHSDGTGPAYAESVKKMVDGAVMYVQDAYDAEKKQWYELLGAIAFGGVIGWTAHYVVHRVRKTTIDSIASFTAAVGGGGVLRAFGSESLILAFYCIGLAAAYFTREFLERPASRRTKKIANELPTMA